MNIFYLHKDPRQCAQMHCDKHVVKMIVEYAQLMSTAHRVLDGELYNGKTKNGRNIKRYRLNDKREDILYNELNDIQGPPALHGEDRFVADVALVADPDTVEMLHDGASPRGSAECGSGGVGLVGVPGLHGVVER